MSSILNDVKKMLNLDSDYHEFDLDVITHINGSFAKLSQIGVRDNFSIEDETTQWTEYLPDGDALSLVKQYLYASVRMTFDPPQTSYILSAIEKLVEQYEWRLNVMCDNKGVST